MDSNGSIDWVKGKSGGNQACAFLCSGVLEDAGTILEASPPVSPTEPPSTFLVIHGVMHSNLRYALDGLLGKCPMYTCMYIYYVYDSIMSTLHQYSR